MQENETFLKRIKKTGYHDEKGLTEIGFALDELAGNQNATNCIYQCNKWLSENFGISPSIFFAETSFPSIIPIFPRYSLSDSLGYKGNLIATSIKTAMSTKNSFVAKKFLYFIDPLEMERSWFKYTEEHVNAILGKMVVFCRSEDHKTYLRSNGVKILDTIVKDFDLTTILGIIKNAN